MSSHQLLGRYGEGQAASFLENAGYQIIARNFRHLRAEIDLIAKKGDILAIVEVKTRTGRSLEHIAEVINRKKIERLVLAADHYVTTRELDVEVRFDIIWISKYGDRISLEHIENAFHHF